MPIGFIRQIGDGTIGANAFGESWEMIDPASGIVWNYSYPGLSSVTALATVTTGWTTSNCTGTEYVINPPPARFAVQLSGKSGYYAVPDAPSLTQVGLVSTMSGGSCTSTSVGTLTFPVSAMKSVTMPTAPPGTYPYHPGISASPIPGAVVWNDSTGAAIGFIRQIGDGTIGANAFGIGWEMIEPASGIVWNYSYPGLSSVAAFANLATGWTTSNCTGTEYVISPPPARFAVQLSGRSSGYYAVPDAPSLTQVGLVSTMNGSCTSTSAASLTFPASAMKTVTMPTTPPGTYPYHPGISNSPSGSSDGGTSIAGAVVWKDATGMPIGFIRQIGDGTIGANAFGIGWEMIDPASGIVWNYSYPGLSSVAALATLTTGWTTGDCTGTEYVVNPPPARFAVQLSGKSGYYAVPDAPTLTQVGIVSTLSGGSCTSTSVGTLTFPVSAMKTVTVPTAPPGTYPYHPELH